MFSYNTLKTFKNGGLTMSYIGVTGFSKREEVSAALEAYKGNNRKLMVGVLATWKSLRGIPMKPIWAKQTPDPQDIKNIFIDDARALNLVHFSTEEGQEHSIADDMLAIHRLGGEHIHGFQLNMTWPSIDQLRTYKEKVSGECYIVLQIGRHAVESAGTPFMVSSILTEYRGVVDAILLDSSGGRGKPFDAERARHILLAIRDKMDDIGLGVAGGLGPHSLDLLEPLLTDFPDINIDAQGRLRNEENELDSRLVRFYIYKASLLLA